MKSNIISFLYSFFALLYKNVSDSFIWKWLGKIHTSLSASFSNSSIIAAIKYKSNTKLEDTSLFCKLLRIPTAVISAICKMITSFVQQFADKSAAAKYGLGYVYGFLAIEVRFFAIMVMFSSVISFIIRLFTGKFSFMLLIFAIAGFGLSFVKVKLVDFIDGSVFIKFFINSLGFEKLKFSIYSSVPDYYMYISGAVIGIVTGIAGCINTLLYAIPVALFGLGIIAVYPIFGIFLTLFFAPILPTMAVVGLCTYTAICTLLHKSYKGEYAIKMGRCGLSLMLFLIISAISTIFSVSIKGSIGVLGMYIIFIGFYYIMRDSIRKADTLEYLFKTLAFSAVIVSVYGIIQYVFKIDTTNAWIDEEMFEEATMRVYSTLANPNVLGEFLILALPVCALVLINYTRTIWQKIVYGTFFVCTLLCLVLTQSRGCWIGFFVSAFLFITYFKSSVWKVFPLLLLFLPLVMPETIINRFLSVGNMSDSSTSYRVYIWFGTLSMLRYFWIGGIGLGEAAFRNIYPYFSYSGIVAPHSHNLYLQLMVESGIMALLVFGFSMIIFIKDMINVQSGGRKRGLESIALMSGVVAFLVQSMFDYTFYNYRVMGIFFMILALGGALVNINSKESQGGLTK